MLLSAPELLLLVVELLTALALAALWLSDRQRSYTLWWALAFLMLPVPGLLTTLTRADPTGILAFVLQLSLSIQAVSLMVGVVNFRANRLLIRPFAAVAAILALALLMYGTTVLVSRELGRLLAVIAMTAAVITSALMLWSAGSYEKLAAACFGLRGGLELTLLGLMALGRNDSPFFSHFSSFNALMATGTALALLIAAYQRSLTQLRDHYQIMALSQELTARLQGVSNEHELAERVLEALSQWLDWEISVVMIPSPTPEYYVALATRNSGIQTLKAGQQVFVPDSGRVAEAVRTQRIQSTSNLIVDARVPNRLRDIGAQMPSLVAIPVTHNHQTLAVVMLRDRRRRRLSSTEMKTLEGLGQVIGLSLASARNLHELAHRAEHDALTGLGNRAALHDFVNAGLRQYPDRRGAVMLFDLDHFKQINDALGHAVGDQLLQALAERLLQHLAGRPARLFRLGGDEFVILHRLNNDDPANALPLAREMADVIAQPIQIGDLSLRVPASIGIAVTPDHGDDSHELLRCADVAMYHAKQHGAGVTLYQRDIDAHKLEHLTLLSAVNEGLEHDQFELHYQPFINLATGAINGCEGLIRWRHPTLGLIGAAEFMPLVEATDLIRTITRRVIDIAVADAARWQQLGIDTRIAINLSARNLLDPELPDYLLAAVARHDVEPRQLQLEVTETILIKDPASAESVMRRLVDAGFTLALDDFGTGYSSLAYLARFPIHTLKIDRSFVRDMLAHAQSRTIVESTIALARGLGLQVTAEGVEQQAEANLLRELGCDCAQGFLYSAAVTRVQLDALRQHGITARAS